MLYERYEYKMQRIANVKQKFVKFKIPIIALLSVMIIALGVLLSVKGNITTDTIGVNDFTYGEKISLYAESLWGDVTFEYKQIGRSTWTDVEPIHPGTYEVRATSNKPFGTAKGESFTYSIFAKESNVKVSNSTVVFGNNCSFTASLVAGDYFVSGDVIFDDEYSLSSQSVIPDIESLVIFNSEDIDVTSCYDFTAIDSSITINKRAVSITSESISKEYDGTALTSDNFTVSNMFDDTKVTVDIEGSQFNFGTSYNNVSNALFMDDKTDVTHMYSISYVTGQLSVTKRDLYIQTSSLSKEYDGIALISDSYTATNLVAGDLLSIVAITSNHYMAGSTDNVISFSTNSENYNFIVSYGTLTITPKDISIETSTVTKTYDGTSLFDYSLTDKNNSLVTNNVLSYESYNDIVTVSKVQNNVVAKILYNNVNVTHCYNISYIYGYLEVTKQDLLIESLGKQKVYDSTPLSNPLYNQVGLQYNDKITVVTSAELTDVGTKVNTISVTIANTQDVTFCYNISYEYGELEVTTRVINVLIDDATKEYDGTPLTSDVWSYLVGNQLSSNHQFEIVTNGTITDYGTTSNGYTSYTIKSNGNDVSGNYEVNVTDGTLTITKRIITVTIGSSSKEYDDTALTNDTYKITSTKQLVSNHILDVVVEGSIVNVGEIANTYVSHNVMNGSTDVTNNYEITFNNGLLIVTPRKISISTTSDEKVYDATELVSHSYEIISTTKLVSTHSIEINYTGTIINVGSTENSLTDIVILKGSTDVTTNYEITKYYGTLVVTHRNISITTLSDRKEYDGTALIKHEYEYLDSTAYELVSGVINHQLFINYTGSQTSVGKSDNTYSGYTIKDGSTDVTSNYIVGIILGELEVTSLSITVTTANNSFVYNGYFQYDDSFTADILVGHYTKIIDIVGEKDVISNGVNKYEISIFDANDKDVTSNYTLTYVYGDLKITKLIVIIVTRDDSKVYDGFELTNEFWDYNGANHFVSIHNFSIINNGTITNVGKTDNTYSSYSILDENYDDVLHNYDLTVNLGELQVLHRVVSITTASGSKVFDDTPLFVSGYELNLDTPYTLVDGHVLEVDAEASVTYVTEGIVQNEYKSYSVTYNGDDVTSNYLFDISTGEIFIELRTVLMITDSDEKVYDATELTKHSSSYLEGNEYEVLTDIHTLDINYTGCIVNAGWVYNTFDDFSIYRTSDNFDLSENYSINIDLGILTILKRTISIYSEDDYKIYDGFELSNSNWDYVTVDNESYFEFVSGHIVKVSIESFIINYGSIENVINDVIVLQGSDDVSNNYNIEFTNGILEIFKREISIETKDDEKVYDGDGLFNFDLIIEVNGANRGIALTDEVQIDSYTTIINFVDGGVVNDVYFTILNTNLNYDGFNPNDNYDITYTTGQLVIMKREVEILTGSSKEIYDGSALNNKTFEITNGSLVDGQRLEVSTFTNVITVSQGILNNELTFFVYDNEEVDLAYNYELICDYGTLEMMPYEISLTTATSCNVYDGNTFSSAKFVSEDGDYKLLGNDNFIIDINNSSSIRYYVEGGIDNVVVFSISNSDFIDVTSNYSVINVEYGKLEILKREVHFKTESYTFMYDGEKHYYEVGSVIYPEDYETYDFVTGDFVTHEFINYVQNVSDGKVENIVEFTFGNSLAIDSYIVKTEYGFIEISQKDLLITTGTSSTEYGSGNWPLTDGTYNTEGLLDGHKLTMTNDGYQEEVGSSYNTYVEGTIVILDADGNDVTSNYTWDVNLGTLTVYSRDIQIKSGGNVQEYDGNVLTNTEITVFKGDEIIHYGNDSFEYAFALTETDILYITITGSNDKLGIEDNSFTWIIFNNGQDVSSNYSVDADVSNFGKLEIIPREIYVTSDSKEFYFDNEEHFWHEYTIDTSNGKNDILYELGHRLHTEFFGVITNVGSIDNLFIAIVVDEFNIELDVYNVNIVYGTLTVLPGELIFTTGSSIGDNAFIYSNKNFFNDEYTITGDLEVDFEEIFDVEIVEGSLTTIRNVGTIENYFEIKIFINGIDSTSYFDITPVYGTLEVIAKEITISVKDNEVVYVYDGTYQTIKSDDVVIDYNGKLTFGEIDEHNIEIVNGTSIFTPGDKEQLYFEVNISDFKNNYDITYEIDSATIQVIKREVKIGTSDVTVEFNGQYQSSTTYFLYDGTTFADGDTLKVIEYSQYKDINYVNGDFITDSSDYLINFTSIEIGNLSDYTLYYDFEIVVYGSLAITKIDVEITIPTDQKTYDGKTLTSTNFSVKGNLLPGNEFELDITGEIINAGTVENSFDESSLKVLGYTYGLDLYDVYNIKYNEGVLTIFKLEVEVSPYTLSREYTSSASYSITHEDYFFYRFSKENIVSGHTLVLDAAEYSRNYDGVLTLENFRVYDQYNNLVTSNYVFTSLSTYVIYTKVSVTITAASAEKVYDGTALYAWDYTLTKGHLIEGHYLEVDMSSTKTTVGTIINRISSYRVVDSDGVEISEDDYLMYYSIETVNGTLTVI